MPLAYEEVVVARCVYRWGKGEYFINNTLSIRYLAVCVKYRIYYWVVELGGRLFFIIGQGKIKEFLSLRSEEKRLFLE